MQFAQYERSGKLAILGLLAAGLLALLYSWERGPAGGTQGITPLGGETVDRAQRNEPEGPVKDGRTVLRPGDVASESQELLRGRVMDAVCGTPLLATVQRNGAERVFTDSTTGSYSIQVADTKESTILVEASGYAPTSVIHPSEGGGEVPVILLEPLGVATIRVLRHDNEPAAQLPVTWRLAHAREQSGNWRDWILPEARARGARQEALTNSAGTVKLRLGSQALAEVRDPALKVSRTVAVSPGQSLTIRLPECGIEVRVVDRITGAPSSGLLVDTWSPTASEGLAVTHITDPTGTFVIDPSSLPLLVRLSARPSQRRLWHLDSPSVLAVSERSAVVRIESVNCGQPVLLAVDGCASVGRIRLTNVNTGGAVEGRFNALIRLLEIPAPDPDFPFVERARIMSPCGTHDGLSASGAVKDGILDWPCHLEEQLAMLAEIDAICELVVAVEGYLPLHIPSIASVLPLGAELRKFELTPVPSRSIRIINEQGQAYRDGATVFAPDSEAYCYESFQDERGVYGPFDWYGGPLEVLLGPDRRRKGAKEVFRLEEAVLQVSEVVTLIVKRPLGSIEITNVPTGANLGTILAKNLETSSRFDPTRQVAGSVFIDDLLPGNYQVGPLDWVDGVERNAYLGWGFGKHGIPPLNSKVEVRAGKVTQMQWLGCWRSEREYTGRVVVSGPRPLQPLLYKIHDLVGPRGARKDGRLPPFIGGRRSARVFTDEDGWYKIAPGELAPHLIAICIPDEGAWAQVSSMHILDVIEPGESLEIQTGSLELHWAGKGAPIKSVRVTYKLPTDSLTHPIRTPLNSCSVRWLEKSILRLEGVPLTITRLTIGQRELPVELSATEVVRYDVDWQELKAPSPLDR